MSDAKTETVDNKPAVGCCNAECLGWRADSPCEGDVTLYDEIYDEELQDAVFTHYCDKHNPWRTP